MPLPDTPLDQEFPFPPLTPVWLQNALRQHLPPYRLAVAALAGLVTVVFLVLVGVLLLIATNFNLLGAIE